MTLKVGISERFFISALNFMIFNAIIMANEIRKGIMPIVKLMYIYDTPFVFKR